MAKILIVEDDEFLRTLLAEKLASSGYDVEPAETGERALEILAGFQPDLVLLDLILPGMHGFDVLGWIKSQAEPLSQTPVIILSNLGSGEDIKKGKELGANDFLVKAKFTPNEISEKVKLVMA